MPEINLVITVPTLRLSAGGVSRYLIDFIRELLSKKISVGVLCSSDKVLDTDQRIEIHSTHFKVCNTGGANNSILSYFSQRYRFNFEMRNLFKHNNTIVHDHGIWLLGNHFSVSFARRNNIPLIVSPHGMLEPWALNNSYFKKKLAWISYQCRDLHSCDVLHATSIAEYENFRNLGFRQPVALIPNAVNLPIVMLSRSRNDNYKKRMLFLSRIHPKKGVSELVAAWSLVRPINWELIIAGPDEGGYSNIIKKQIIQANLTDSVRLVGPVYGEDKTNLFLSADIFVLPTHSENFGLVVAEALSYGVPVITTKGAPWEPLLETRSGWWIDIGIEPLVKAISSATSMPQRELVEMGIRGREMIRSHYAWEDVSEKMIAVYNWLLKRADCPTSVILD